MDRNQLQRRIAIRLKSVCREKKISQRELSKMTGITRETINRCCNGNQMPEIFTLVCIAKALNVSMDYFVFKKEGKK